MSKRHPEREWRVIKPMQYLKDAPLLDRKGVAFEVRPGEIASDTPPCEAQTMRRVLWAFVHIYQPTPWLTLETNDIRRRHKVLDTLEHEPQPHPGWIALEDAHYELVKRMVTALCPHYPGWADITPQFEDALATALSKIPAEEGENAVENS